MNLNQHQHLFPKPLHLPEHRIDRRAAESEVEMPDPLGGTFSPNAVMRSTRPIDLGSRPASSVILRNLATLAL